MRVFNDEEKFAAAQLARQDLYFFSRWMFLQRKNFNWLRAKHHKLICDALMRVFNGECKRLIINIPPRYSKTELAVINFIAWAMGRAPDSEFIHVSYSSTLATNNSSQIRAMVQHEEFQRIFPELQLDSAAQHHWKTTAGGVMYATGTGGTITGFGAGKHRPDFAGCFPKGTKVWTNKGLIPIDEIVRNRMNVSTWSYDYNGNMVLRPVIDWHENPANDIVRVSFDDGAHVECTPDHRFWTNNRGWVRADSLREDDCLPRVQRGIEGINYAGINSKSFRDGSDSIPVVSSSSIGSCKDCDIGLFSGKNCSVISGDSTRIDYVNSSCYRLPNLAIPNSNNSFTGYAKFFSNRLGVNTNGIVNSESVIVGDDGARMDFSLAESSMPLAVNDVLFPRIISKIGKSVVRWIAVKMANIKSFWSFSNKSKHDKGMDGCISNFGVSRKTDSKISSTKRIWLKKNSRLNIFSSRSFVDDFSSFASHSSEIADGVEPFISGDRKPILVEHVRHDDSTFCLTVKEYHNFTIESGFVVKNCIIIDDPHKADEARSDVMRQNVIEWFQTTLESRKNSPDTPIIVIMQRLHEDDLAGWLLRGGNGETWEHLCLSAWNDDQTPLWPDKHDADTLRIMEQAAPYVFAGQYRQLPAPPDGGIIKPDMIETVDAIPAGVTRWFRGWDFGASIDGDYTAGGLIGKLEDGRYIIADVVRAQAETNERDSLLVNTAKRDGQKVKISIPQDPGQAGKSQIVYLTKQLAGFAVRSSPESGDKITRAEPLAAQINVGNVMMLRAPWNDALIAEMRIFPNGKHDDQVDCLSRAFSEVIASRSTFFG